MNVFKTGHVVRLGHWAGEPCWRCQHQPVDGEVVQIDYIAQTVLCEKCSDEDNQHLLALLAASFKKLYPDDET